ncbi:hypothetical protein ACNKHQ_06430 [Shigella flexneri]
MVWDLCQFMIAAAGTLGVSRCRSDVLLTAIADADEALICNVLTPGLSPFSMIRGSSNSGLPANFTNIPAPLCESPD